MKKKIKILLSATVCVLSASASFAQETFTKERYETAKHNADAVFKTQAESCLPLKDNAKDVCIAKAKAQRIRSIAQAEARHKNTPEATKDALVKIADADYDVAKETCDDLKGNQKDVCVQQAKAAHTSAVADAKSRNKGLEEKEDAREDKMEARYKVEKEKCDALSGSQKDDCEKRAKERFNK